MNNRTAQEAVEQTSVTVTLPVVVEVVLPSLDHVAWYAGVTLLALFGVIDWAVAVLLAAGEAPADNRRHRALQELGSGSSSRSSAGLALEVAL